MSMIPVNLPDELHAFVQAKVQDGQFANANDFIVALVDAARRKRNDLELALIAGLESGPAEEWKKSDWDDIRRRVTQQPSKKNHR